MGATINPQDVAHGLYENNPPAELIEGFCLAPAAGGDLESRPVVHVQLRRAAQLTAVEADRLAKACQHGVLRQLATGGRDCSGTSCEDPSAHEIAIALHPYGTGPFADASSIRNTSLRDGED
ncbi:coenzyme f390 synthetase [Streptomyces inhibens]|uniref:coenzyme f390 synthetase n=1 Tax=Streptomyces inhibens TaxID=2293571 RepID=UPI00402A701A